MAAFAKGHGVYRICIAVIGMSCMASWAGYVRAEPAGVQLQRLLGAVAIDHGFGPAGGFGVDVGIWMGRHFVFNCVEGVVVEGVACSPQLYSAIRHS